MLLLGPENDFLNIYDRFFWGCPALGNDKVVTLPVTYSDIMDITPKKESFCSIQRLPDHNIIRRRIFHFTDGSTDSTA